MRVSRILSPVTALGPGRRVGLWVQGCDLACAGCASADTWDPTAGQEVDEDAVVSELVGLIRSQGLTGLTLSGGEPFQQGSALARVVRAVKDQVTDVDVLAFTGYAAGAARGRGSDLYGLLDIVVAGRYDRSRPGGGPLLASDNQELIVLTELGRARLDEGSGPRLQVSATEDELFILGLPEVDDLRRLEAELVGAGVHLENVSWLA